jgi:SAM-dependent methyltransferase
MAIACPVDLDTRQLRSEVSNIYSRVVTEPQGEFHFHRGPAYAAELLGYDAEELAALPPETTRSFAGIANPHRIGSIRAGETVLDIGCGAGMDLLLAARRVGPTGRAIGVDMTDAMVEWSSPTVCSISFPKRNAPSTRSCECSSRRVASIWPTSFSISNCRRILDAILTCGPVESPALCRRQR